MSKLTKCILLEICKRVRVVVVIYQGNKTVRISCYLTVSSVLRCMDSPVNITVFLDVAACIFVTRAQCLLRSAELETLSIFISYIVDGT